METVAALGRKHEELNRLMNPLAYIPKSLPTSRSGDRTEQIDIASSTGHVSVSVESSAQKQTELTDDKIKSKPV